MTDAAVHPWHADLERLRARTAQPGLADLQRVHGLSGLEFLQGIVQGTIPDPPITRTLDFYLLEVEPGRATFLGLPGFAYYNGTTTCMILAPA